jgi:hypothetical protein
MKRPRGVITDDHVLVFDGLRRIPEPECEIVAVVEDGPALCAIPGDRLRRHGAAG